MSERARVVLAAWVLVGGAACSSRVVSESEHGLARGTDGGLRDTGSSEPAPGDGAASARIDRGDGAADGAAPDAGRDRDAACVPSGMCEFYTPYVCDAGQVAAIVDPCGECGPSYWVAAHQCARGCRADYATFGQGADYHWWSSPEELCEETRPKTAGSREAGAGADAALPDGTVSGEPDAGPGKVFCFNMLGPSEVCDLARGEVCCSYPSTGFPRCVSASDHSMCLGWDDCDADDDCARGETCHVTSTMPHVGFSLTWRLCVAPDGGAASVGAGADAAGGPAVSDASVGDATAPDAR